jgi:hypothetical protein
MRPPLRAWTFGVMVSVLALINGVAEQTPAKDIGEAPGIVPSSFGEAVDRDRFKTTEAAEAFGYKRVTGCVQYQPGRCDRLSLSERRPSRHDARPGTSGGAGLREDARRHLSIEWRRIPCADFRLEINRAPAHRGCKPSRKQIRSASGTFTFGPGSRVQAVFLPPGIPTSSAWRLLRWSIR